MAYTPSSWSKADGEQEEKQRDWVGGWGEHCSSGHLPLWAYRIPTCPGSQLHRMNCGAGCRRGVSALLHILLLLQTRNGKWNWRWKLALPFSTLRYGRQEKLKQLSGVKRPPLKNKYRCFLVVGGKCIRRQRKWFLNYQLIVYIDYIQQYRVFLFILSIQSYGDTFCDH